VHNLDGVWRDKESVSIRRDCQEPVREAPSRGKPSRAPDGASSSDSGLSGPRFSCICVRPARTREGEDSAADVGDLGAARTRGRSRGGPPSTIDSARKAVWVRP
jgi:hypothetical protein